MSGDPDVTRRVREALESADEPLSTGQIQRHIAAEGLDMATSAIRAACRDLVEDGTVENVGEQSRDEYRIAE